MKKLFRTLSLLLAAAILSSCGSAVQNAPAADLSYPSAIGFEDYDARADVREKNPVDNDFITAVNRFSSRSAQLLLKSKAENINYSPFSLYMALAIAATGAKGATRNEIFSLLEMKGRSTEYLSTQAGNLFRLLYTDNGIGQLKSANSLWLQKDMPFKKAFTDNAVSNFYASLHNVDFSDSLTGKEMGKWVSDNTGGVLTPDLETQKGQILSILNTLYLKDEWINRFDEKDTRPGTFHLESGEEISCDFMNSTFITHGFTKGKGFTSSALSLKNAGSMVFILPDRGVSVDSLLDSAEPSLFNANMEENGKVVFQVPKFSFGSDLDLKDALKELGMRSAFEKNADFSGITDGMAFISAISQQSHIAVNEKGVEAAAFTRIDYMGAALAKDKTAEMILDRPFLYGIVSNGGTLLFIGVCRNPAVE